MHELSKCQRSAQHEEKAVYPAHMCKLSAAKFLFLNTVSTIKMLTRQSLGNLDV